MIIRKVQMENFRGFRQKTLDFKDKPVVLLSAANGIGKTTTVDAVEWCLTGNIGRLKNAFKTRSTNDDDRKLNSHGILKHRDADDKAITRVSLWLFDGEKERILCREQKKDELNPVASTFTLDGSKQAAKNFFQEYIGDSFYNFHFCDIQKSFNIQSQKRTKLDSLFQEFITNYDAQRQVAKNLDTFAEDVGRHMEDAKKQKVSQDVIANLKAQLAKARESAKQVTYPGTIFYPDEKTQIEGMNQEALLAQRDGVQNCGYRVALDALDKLVNHDALRSQQTVIREIASFWETKGAAIEHAVHVGFHKNTDAITELEQTLEMLNSLQLVKKTILQDGEQVAALGNAGFTRANLNAVRQKIEQKHERVKALSSEIDLLSNNNKMLKLLSSLVTEEQAVIQYRDAAVAETGAIRCPVCGSESFAIMEAGSILQDAKAYIRQNGEAVQAKDAEKASLQSEIQGLYKMIIRRVKSVVEEEKAKITAEISGLKVLKDEVQPYFRAVRKLQKTPLKIKVEELTAEKTAQILTAVENALLEEAEEQRAIASYQQILTVLGYSFENENVQQTHAKVRNLVPVPCVVLNFSYEALVSKLNAIDSLLANQSLLELQQQLDADKAWNRDLDAKIEALQNLKDKATQRAEDIRSIVEDLSKDEYEKVGPALSKFYNKLARFNAGGGIRIIQEEEGLSLVDNKGKNIVNVLSNGQISVFMLAHFFAGINARNEREKMKVYFIDDLTACMDDVNMLAFMDLLKYQMTSKETMAQLFFITCDDRISKLLKYKLSGRGIELCELLEPDFAETISV